MSFSLVLVLTAAAGFADLDMIDREVAAFTGASVGEQGGAATPVDRRLRLNPCAAPLALSWRSDRRDSVLVQCPVAGGWRLYVPVRGAAAGMAASALPAINKGDAVTIAVTGDGFSVSQPGEALEGGPVGAWIRVRGAAAAAKFGANDAMRARIVRPGLVSVPLN